MKEGNFETPKEKIIANKENSAEEPNSALSEKEEQKRTYSMAEQKDYLIEYLQLDLPEKAEGIKFIKAEELPAEYGEQYRFLNDKRLAETLIAVIPDQFWKKGQPSESNAGRNLILFRDGYFNDQQQEIKDGIAWMIHELAHCQKFEDPKEKNKYEEETNTVAFEDIGTDNYPNNRVEEHAFTKQFEYLYNNGVTREQILEMLKNYYNEEDYKFFNRLLDKVFT